MTDECSVFLVKCITLAFSTRIRQRIRDMKEAATDSQTKRIKARKRLAQLVMRSQRQPDTPERSRLPLPVADTRTHICSPACYDKIGQSGEQIVYMCSTTGNIHVCGSAFCAFQEVDTDSSDSVCTITSHPLKTSQLWHSGLSSVSDYDVGMSSAGHGACPLEMTQVSSTTAKKSGRRNNPVSRRRSTQANEAITRQTAQKVCAFLGRVVPAAKQCEQLLSSFLRNTPRPPELESNKHVLAACLEAVSFALAIDKLWCSLSFINDESKKNVVTITDKRCMHS